MINIDANDRNGDVVGMKLVCDDDEVMLITEKGILMRTRVNEIRETGRNAAGVRLIRIDEGDRLVWMARVDISEMCGVWNCRPKRQRLVWRVRRMWTWRAGAGATDVAPAAEDTTAPSTPPAGVLMAEARANRWRGEGVVRRRGWPRRNVRT